MADLHVGREREAFEAWCTEHGLPINRLSDSYGAPNAYREDATYNAWIAWQARARAAGVPVAGIAAYERHFPHEFEVWQDDMMQAGVSGTRDQAWAEAQRYAMVYSRDSIRPVRIFEVHRVPVAGPGITYDVSEPTSAIGRTDDSQMPGGSES